MAFSPLLRTAGYFMMSSIFPTSHAVKPPLVDPVACKYYENHLGSLEVTNDGNYVLRGNTDFIVRDGKLLDNDGDLPPIPVPTSISNMPPAESPRFVVSTTKDQLWLYWHYDHGSIDVWVPDRNSRIQKPGLVQIYWGNHPDYTLTYRRFWRQVGSSLLSPGAEYSQTYSTTEGISQTTSETFAANLGVNIKGLSAAVSLSFGKSITVNNQQTVTKDWTYENSTSKTQSVILWQLYDEVIALDKSTGQVVTWPWGTIAARVNTDPSNPFAVLDGSMMMDGGSGQYIIPSNTYFLKVWPE